eukprot:6189358-Amphidinium_carterae.1
MSKARWWWQGCLKLADPSHVGPFEHTLLTKGQRLVKWECFLAACSCVCVVFVQRVALQRNNVPKKTTVRP